MKHVLGFSGGADSQAAALWLRQHYPAEDVILTYADPGGNDHPMTREFIEEYSRTIHPVIIITPIVADLQGRATGAIAERGLLPTDPLTFPLLAELKGRYPSTKAAFCTTHLKLAPMRRWCYDHGARGLNPRRSVRRDGHLVEVDGFFGPEPHISGILSDGRAAGINLGFERYAGVRRDESAARADVLEREYDDATNCWLNRPLATWSKDQVFATLAAAGEPINPLYRLGFGRVGCAPCINSGKEDIRLWAARFPAMIDKVRDWEARVGRTFFPPVLPGGRHGFIDEVVEWSRTTRGSKQYGLTILESEVASGRCMSQWGLCE